MKNVIGGLVSEVAIGSVVKNIRPYRDDEAVKMAGVLVSMVGGRSGNSKGITTVVEDGACNEDGRGRGGTIGGRDADDAEIVIDFVRHSELLQLGASRSPG